MKKRYWSKFEPNTTAVVVGDPDVRGMVPAYVSSDQYPDGPIATGILLDEWSDVEVVPVPESVPPLVWLLVYGDDPAEPKYQVFHSEVDVAVASAKTPNSFGYLQVEVRRTMIPSR